MTFWNGFKEWVMMSFQIHPIYTCALIAGSFTLGLLLG